MKLLFKAYDKMPYKIVSVGTKYAVQNTQTKHTHGFTTQANAKAQLRIINQYEAYKKKTGKM